MDVKDYLSTPSSGACALAGGLLAVSACFCAVAAVMGNPYPAVIGSPFFLGALVGLFAIRRPARIASVGALLGLAALGVWIAVTATGHWMGELILIVSAVVLVYIMPLMILGAVCTATVRRWFRGRAAHAFDLEFDPTLGAHDAQQTWRAAPWR